MDVTALSFTVDGDLLATSSLDSTVFFFHSSNGYKPLGFIKAPGPVTCIDWSPSGLNLLLGCSNGKIMEVARPGFEVDSQITFELKLPAKLYTFSLPEVKEVPQKAPPSSATKGSVEETQKQTSLDEKEIEEGKKNQGELSGIGADSQVDLIRQINDQPPEADSETQPRRKSQISKVDSKETKVSETSTSDSLNGDLKNDTRQVELGEVASLAGENSSQEASRRSVHEIAQDGNSFAVRALLYTNSNLNTFYVAMEGSTSGLIFECHIDMKEVMGVTKWHSTPIKCLQYSSSKQYIISGHDDGVVRVQTAPTPGQLSVMQKHVFWEGRSHDGFTGVVGGAMISFDHQYLASAAYDGSFYVQELKFEKPKHIDIQMEGDKVGDSDNNSETDFSGAGVTVVTAGTGS
ncbi:hypothetical protein L7F22_010298 [Adiantum nelumboides]|nr:hypothetical protein [Adiantum nelumboides]